MKKNAYIGGALLVAFAVGVLVGVKSNPRGGDSGAESAEASSESPVSIPRKNAPAFAAGNSASSEAASGDSEANGDRRPEDPTLEEIAAGKDLQRRVIAGEYILGSDNPHVLRMRHESLQKVKEMVVPPITAVRQEFLSTLGVDEKTILTFTNHAARIAEASFAVKPLQGELRQAKIDYDRNARRMLTPEQYAEFKEFETRQAVEAELQQTFKVEGAEHLAYNDLVAISDAIAELDIREIRPNTYFPYEPDPVDDTIPGEVEDEVYSTKIAKLDEATQNLNQYVEQNQLSDQARQLLSSMIENRAQFFRMALERSGEADREHQAMLRSLAPPNARPRPGP